MTRVGEPVAQPSRRRAAPQHGWWPNERGPRAVLGVALLVGAALRLWDLARHPLHNDELSTWWRADVPGLGQVLERVRGDVHPPGHVVITWLTERVLGDGEAALRMPSALAGVVAIYAIYQLGRLLFSEREGAAAALVLSVAAQGLLFSRFARAYSLMTCLAIVAAACAVAWLRAERRDRAGPRLAVGAGLCIAALPWLHYFGLLMAGFVGGAWILGALLLDRRRAWVPLLGCGLAAVAYLPWLAPLLEDLGAGGLSYVKRPPVGALHRLGTLTIPMYLPVLAAAMALALRGAQAPAETTAAAAAEVSAGSAEDRLATVFVLAWAIGLPAFVWAWSQRGSVWTSRNLFVFGPGELLLLARILVLLAGRHRATLTSLLVAGVVVAQQTQAGVSLGGGTVEDFRGAAAWTVQHVGDASDVAVIAVANNEDYFNYYFERTGSPLRVARLVKDPKKLEDTVAELLHDHREVEVLWGHRTVPKKTLRKLTSRFQRVAGVELEKAGVLSMRIRR